MANAQQLVLLTIGDIAVIAGFVDLLAHEQHGRGGAAIQIDGGFAAQFGHLFAHPDAGFTITFGNAGFNHDGNVVPGLHHAKGGAGVGGIAKFPGAGGHLAVFHQDGAEGQGIGGAGGQDFFGSLFAVLEQANAAVGIQGHYIQGRIDGGFGILGHIIEDLSIADNGTDGIGVIHLCLAAYAINEIVRVDGKNQLMLCGDFIGQLKGKAVAVFFLV